MHRSNAYAHAHAHARARTHSLSLLREAADLTSRPLSHSHAHANTHPRLTCTCFLCLLHFPRRHRTASSSSSSSSSSSPSSIDDSLSLSLRLNPQSDAPSPPPLHRACSDPSPTAYRMGHWQDKLVYYRDFAYPHRSNRRIRMANGNVGDCPAPAFAEYVFTLPSSRAASPSPPPSPLFPPATPHHNPPGAGLRRPRLAHRLHSDRLLVQAKAKSLRQRLLSGPLVDVYVGPSKRLWSLHRNLLCHHSERLQTDLSAEEAPSNGWLNSKKKREPERDRLDLADDDPVGFELLVKWLYQGKLDDVSELPEERKYDYAVACHKLYALCERFEMAQLGNLAMDQYRKALSESQLVPDAEEVNEIYRRSPRGSPFRKLMTKIAARQIMDPDSDKDADCYRACFVDNPDFAVDMINAIKQGTGGFLFDDPTDGDNCSYHDHADGPSCQVKLKAKQGSPKAKPPPADAQPALPNGELTPPPPPPRRKSKSPTKKGAANGVVHVNGHRDAGGGNHGGSPTGGAQSGGKNHGRGNQTGGGGGQATGNTPSPGRRPPPKLRRRGS